MDDSEQATSNRIFFNRAIEASIRIGLLFVLVAWCFRIISPFLSPVLWGVIIAVAVHPFYVRLAKKIGGRNKTSAFMLTVVGLVILMVPSFLLIGSMVDGARDVAASLQSGKLEIPPPPQRVWSWPLVGQSVGQGWQLASENLEAALQQFGPQLRDLGNRSVGAAAGAGLGILMFLFSIVIAGALLVHGEAGGRAVRAFATKLTPERGIEFATIAESTVRNVARGILGVALIQALLAGVGFWLAGVPAAGLWTLACLVLGVVQIGILPVTIPVVIYMYSVADGTTATALLIWCIVISPLDNILKPILLGRGSQTPMLVIFLGAIGGFISSGIIGLFTGAVILSLGYMLFTTWLFGDSAGASQQSSSTDPDIQT